MHLLPRKPAIILILSTLAFCLGYFNKQIAPLFLTPEMPLAICLVVLVLIVTYVFYLKSTVEYLRGRNSELEERDGNERREIYRLRDQLSQNKNKFRKSKPDAR